MKMNMNLYFYSFILILTITLLVYGHIKEQPIEQIRKNIFLYGFLTSSIYGVIGHLFYAKNVRKSMNWGSSKGVVTLQRELGIVQLSMLILGIVCYAKKDFKSCYVLAVVWSIFILLAGINHFIVGNKSPIAFLDIVQGAVMFFTFYGEL